MTNLRRSALARTAAVVLAGVLGAAVAGCSSDDPEPAAPETVDPTVAAVLPVAADLPEGWTVEHLAVPAALCADEALAGGAARVVDPALPPETGFANELVHVFPSAESAKTYFERSDEPPCAAEPDPATEDVKVRKNLADDVRAFRTPAKDGDPASGRYVLTVRQGRVVAKLLAPERSTFDELVPTVVAAAGREPGAESLGA